MEQALFFADPIDTTFNGLSVYLDSPMVFALLGMDVPARIESSNQLLKKIQSAGCVTCIFDHSLEEVKGILSNAVGWAFSSDYSIDKANNAAKFFHNGELTKQEAVEFCENVEDKLAENNIIVKKTDYSTINNSFQEDENQLKEMIEAKYAEQNQTISDEKRLSIGIDVRSIIMIYRLRNGMVSNTLQSCQHVMVTLNAAIANVSKKYESNQSINSGHIPACVSADLFGAVLWLFSPIEHIEFQKKQLLADCYVTLQPSKRMLEKYVESLIFARNAGEIDEKKFLFLRAHSVVYDALMNVTKGDYARFNERTYIDVFNEIEEKAKKEYKEEAEAHLLTKKRWDEADKKQKEEIDSLKEKVDKLNRENISFEEQLVDLLTKIYIGQHRTTAI